MATETTTETTWSAPPPTSPAAHALVERLEQVEAIDPPANAVAKAVRGVLGPGALKDALSGKPLGHALHPLLTDTVIGSWTSATILDLIGGERSQTAADRLIGVGLLASLPTSASGMSDWADSTVGNAPVRRVGAMHALLNVGALALYGASLAARRGGRRGTGVVLGLAGAGVLGASGHLGGHLSYARGIGVDQTVFDADVPDWTTACFASEVREGAPYVATIQGTEILLVRDDGAVRALANRCSHRGGALDEGEIEDGCVTCPLHASRFRLRDGGVDRGPACYPQPTYDVRLTGDHLEVRSAAARP